MAKLIKIIESHKYFWLSTVLGIFVFSFISCGILSYETDEEKWLKQENKKIENNYEIIYDYQNYGHAHDFHFTDDGWIFHFFEQTQKREWIYDSARANTYGHDYYVDSIHVLSNNFQTSYGISLYDSTVKYFNNVCFRNRKIFLLGSYQTPGSHLHSNVSIHAIDSSFNTEYNILDTILNKTSILSSTRENSYFIESNNSIHCFDFVEERIDFDCIQDIDTLKSPLFILDNPYFYSIDSNKIVKKDLNHNVKMTISPIFEVRNFIIEDNQIYACGREGKVHSTMQSTTGNMDPYIGKWDMNGNLIWQVNYEKGSISDGDDLRRLWIDASGNIVSVGVTRPRVTGDEYLYFLVADQNGKLLHEKIISIKERDGSVPKFLEIDKIDHSTPNVVRIKYRANIVGDPPQYSGIFFSEINY